MPDGFDQRLLHAPRVLSAHLAARSVAAGPQPVFMAQTFDEKGVITHRSRNQRPLAVMRGSGALAVHIELALGHHHVVGHIHNQARCIGRGNACQLFAHQLRQRHAVEPRIARSHAHRLQIVLRQRAAQAIQTMLRVFDTLRPLLPGQVHPAATDIKADIARAGVDHHRDIALLEPRSIGGMTIVDFIDHAELQKVVTASQVGSRWRAQQLARLQQGFRRVATLSRKALQAHALGQFGLQAVAVHALP